MLRPGSERPEAAVAEWHGVIVEQAVPAYLPAACRWTEGKSRPVLTPAVAVQ